MREKNLLCGSGGGSKAEQLFIMAREVSKLVRPDILVGTSASGYAFMLHSLIEAGILKEQKVRHYLEHRFQKRMWLVKPVTKKGKLTLRAYWRFVKSQLPCWKNKVLSLGIQNDEGMIRDLITETMFDIWKQSDAPPVYVCAVDIEDGSRKLWNLKEAPDFQTFILWLSSTARIPFWTQPAIINGRSYYDGGIRDFMPGGYAMRNLKIKGVKFKHVSALYSKSLKQAKPDKLWNQRGVLGPLMRTLSIYDYEVSKNDSAFIRKQCKLNGLTPPVECYLPDMLSGPYDFDRQKHNQMNDLAVKAVQDGFYGTNF